jgi:hypothetical protein
MATLLSARELDAAAFAELEDDFRGELLRVGDPAYDEHRKVWNGSIERFPALISRCAGVADVIAAVRFARGPESKWPCAAAATVSPACRPVTAAC